MKDILTECIICGEKNVYPENDADIGVGVLYDYGDRICEICYTSESENIKKEIENLKNRKNSPILK
jgi:hypothetical protein